MTEPAEIPHIVYMIGEICVALIGFTGLVSVFGHKRGEAWSREEILRLHTLIEPAACGLFGSLIPPTLILLIQDPEVLWRVSCGVMSVFILIAFIAYMVRARTAQQTVSQRILSGISSIVLVTVALAAIGFVPRPDFVMLIGLWLAVVVAAHNFALLLFDLAKQSLGDQG